MDLKWFLGWILMFPLLKLLTGIEIYGSVPKKGPFVIACNHVSFLDPPVVGITACREVYFLAKVGLFQLSKFFTWLIKTYNAIPISGTQGLRTAIKILKSGNVVVIFPEGTRSRKGYMLEFTTGVSYLSVKFGFPVIPAYITNSNKKFISLILRINRLKIRYGKPIYPTDFKKESADLTKFAAKIKEEMLKLK
jgi:1-acyl-sn-glycerol-3-phosphate acyltransferase